MSRGRPPKQDPLTTRCDLKCTAEQRAAWALAADADGRTLAEWMRRQLDAAARALIAKL